jgi:hypothetical protein
MTALAVAVADRFQVCLLQHCQLGRIGKKFKLCVKNSLGEVEDFTDAWGITAVP